MRERGVDAEREQRRRGGRRPLRTVSLPSFELGEELPLGERDRRLAACLPARLADWGRRESETRTPAAAAATEAQGRLGCRLPRAGIRRTDGRRTMHYLRLRIRRGGTGEKGQRGGAHPRDENSGRMPTYLPIGLPRRRREVIFAREGEVVKGFGLGSA